VTGYKIYVHNALNNDSIGLPIFDEIGTTKDLFFELPKLSFRTGIVAVAAITPTRSSELRLSAPVVFNDRSLSMLSTSSGFIKTSATTFEPANITLSASISGFQSPEISGTRMVFYCLRILIACTLNQQKLV
jgi:hypothetical protein